MNSIEMSLVLVDKNQKLIIEDIPFSGICYVKIFVDGISLLDEEAFQGSLVYFEELERSSMGSGRFLIFTSVSGIADDAGWDYIEVLNSSGAVKWSFVRDKISYLYEFDEVQYTHQIQKIKHEIDQAPKDLVLEPSGVIYPEEDDFQGV